MNKKLAMLLLAPMLLFMVVPVATVSAHFYNTSVYVSCENYYYTSASAVVKIAGLKIAVYCPQGGEGSGYEYFTCIYLAHPTTYTATMQTDISVLKH